MPAAKKKSTSPPKVTVPTPQPENTEAVPTLPILYDTLQVVEYSTTSAKGPLTAARLKVVMGWETEKEWQQRMVKEKLGSNLEDWLFDVPTKLPTGEVVVGYHCTNTDKVKVRCWRNANNRPFDEGWCEALIHTILEGQWAGPFTLPGETVNCEVIRVSKYGRVISGQHQATACIIADELLQKSRMVKGNAVDPKYPAWNGQQGCFIETLVATGMSEHEKVLQTVDYVKPRTTADMLYTMEVFRNKTSVDRREMTRMLSAAIDLLWTRAGTQGYRTHTEIVGFLERHKRLLKCVEHLFVENKQSADGGRRISKLNISAGMCAGLCYLMGCSSLNTDGDVYRNGSPPGESTVGMDKRRALDWELWDKAQDFWVHLAQDKTWVSVRHALVRLVKSTTTNEENQGMGGAMPEKLAILAKAWEVYRDHPASAGPPFSDADLSDGGVLRLQYSDLDDKGKKLPNGQIKLINVADFYGIDCPPKGFREQDDPPIEYTEEELERALAATRARREQAK